MFKYGKMRLSIYFMHCLAHFNNLFGIHDSIFNLCMLKPLRKGTSVGAYHFKHKLPNENGPKEGLWFEKPLFVFVSIQNPKAVK